MRISDWVQTCALPILARKVDALREVRAEEEKSLEAFRVKTLEAIHEETTREQAKLDALKTEVADLETRKKRALEPLKAIEDELARVKTEQDERMAAQDIREADIAEREHDLNLRDINVSQSETAAKINRKSAEEILMDATANRKAAKEELEKATDIRKEAESYEEKTAADLSAREQAVAHKEDENRRWEERNRAREEELTREWSKVNDRQAMWEKLIKRAQ